MSRIQRAFERRFNELLGELGARRREQGVAWLFRRAQGADLQEVSRRLTEENIRLAGKVRQFQLRRAIPIPETTPPVVCDAGLGALARWLRASGWEAHWEQNVTDARLVAEAQRLNAVLITTDSFILDRRPIARGEVRAIWVPPTINRFEQLRLVLAELGRTDADSRCMKCGGALRQVEKQTVRDRIPPKTFRWLDEYYECERCGKLFWHGTHWKDISDRLHDQIARPETELERASAG